jgi:tetratricopeptide (TPR) repeat protein
MLGALCHVFWQAGQAPSLAAIRKAANEKRWNEVEEGLRRWLKERPRDGDAWRMLGGVLFDHGRWDEATEALRHVPEGDAAWAPSQELLGEIAVQRHDLPTAERAFRRAAEGGRASVEPLKRLASLLVLERRTAEAHDVLRRLFRATQDPQYLADGLLLAHVDSEVRDLSPELEQYLNVAPGDPWLRRAWGLYLASRGRADEALPHLEAAARTFKDDPIGRFALAECRMALGVAVDLDVLGAPPSKAPDAARWWVLRARLAGALSLPEKVLASLRKAVATDPSHAEAHYRLCQELTRRGDDKSAGEHLRQAEMLGHRQDLLKRALRRVQRQAPDARSYLELARLCEEDGHPSEAHDWFELAIRHDPQLAKGLATPAASQTSSDTPSFALSRPILRESKDIATPEGAPTPSRPVETAPRFEDIAERAGVRFQYDPGDTPKLFIGDTMGGGVGLLDFDEDGWLDIYFVNGCALPVDRNSPPSPNRLYRNRKDGTFEDVTVRANVVGRGYGMGCAVGDYDGDGHDDLFVTGLEGTILYRNRGDGTFEDVTARAGVFTSRWSTAAGFGDLDADGDLDLMVVTYVAADPRDPLECRDRAGRLIHCQPDRFPAQHDHLFRNNGDGTFTDVSREAGIEVPEGKGLGLAIADLDGDRKLDLFVANDGVPNFLFRNLGGLRFEEVGLASGVAYNGSGLPTASMGVVAEDLNGDGLIDLFHVNFIEQTSTLRWNLGGGQFTDGTLAANLAAASRSKTGFGTVAVDVDNDGRLDLFVANGHTDDQPWFQVPMAQTPQLFMGLPGGRFAPAVSSQFPYLTRPVVGRGVAAGDLDNDGRVDLVVVHRDVPAALLRNTTSAGHCLVLNLRGTRSGTTPVGARVVCQVGDRVMARWLTSGTSYLSCSDRRLAFGLGAAVKADRVEIRWPSGRSQSWTDVAADRVLDVREGSEPVARTLQGRVDPAEALK